MYIYESETVRVVVNQLCDPRDCSPPGSSVHGVLQARVLECIAILFSLSLFSLAFLSLFSLSLSLSLYIYICNPAIRKMGIMLFVTT